MSEGPYRTQVRGLDDAQFDRFMWMWISRLTFGLVLVIVSVAAAGFWFADVDWHQRCVASCTNGVQLAKPERCECK